MSLKYVALFFILGSALWAAPRTLTCSSDDGRRHECRADTRSEVRLTRQISDNPCEYRRTWGYSNGSVWVDRGCRAEFTFDDGQRGPAYAQTSAGQIFTCASDDGKRQYCPTDTRGGIRMVRQISDSPCRRGDTWDFTGDAVWVDRGCRAEFTSVNSSRAFGRPGAGQRYDNPWVYNDNNRDWRPDWNQRPFPQSGVCLFTDADFRGNRFCINRGDQLDHLPGNFGDNISSVQVFGNARVQVYNDRNFTGGSFVFRNSVRDLRDRSFRADHTWNNRISSVAVR